MTDYFVQAYLTAALWTEEEQLLNQWREFHARNDLSDPEEGPSEPYIEQELIAPKTLKQAQEDCAAFKELAGDLLNGIDEEQAGHDFWLTRNRHGAGFWDRDLGEVGEKLSEIAKSFGERAAIFGNDGYIYFE